LNNAFLPPLTFRKDQVPLRHLQGLQQHLRDGRLLLHVGGEERRWHHRIQLQVSFVRLMSRPSIRLALVPQSSQCEHIYLIRMTCDADVCTSRKSFRRAAPSGATMACTAVPRSVRWAGVAPTPAARTETSATAICGRRRRTSRRAPWMVGMSLSKVRALLHVIRP